MLLLLCNIPDPRAMWASALEEPCTGAPPTDKSVNCWPPPGAALPRGRGVFLLPPRPIRPPNARQTPRGRIVPRRPSYLPRGRHTCPRWLWWTFTPGSRERLAAARPSRPKVPTAPGGAVIHEGRLYGRCVGRGGAATARGGRIYIYPRPDARQWARVY